VPIVTPNSAAARRRRAYVAVSGADAKTYLQRMLSNDVEALEVGETCEALLLTPKARVIAPLVVLRRGPDDFLLLTEPELGAVVQGHLERLRLRARVAVEPEEHTSLILFGGGESGIPVRDYGAPAVEVIDGHLPARARLLEEEELEALRIAAGTARFGREIDDRVLPAEAGLVERFVSFSKGCYPGQEPIARLHYRGHSNRSLRVLRLDGDELPAYDAEVTYDGKAVGRVTSAARDEGGIVALAYVRVEVPEDAELRVGDATARPLEPATPR
jgi:folate-binding protein YgfZ